MAEDTNSSTGNSFGSGDIDLSESVFAPLLELGLDVEDIFGNIGAPTVNFDSEGDSSMDGNGMQGGENVNIGPFNRLLDIEGVDGVEDIFGGLMGSGENPFGGAEGGESGGDEVTEGGNPFAGGMGGGNPFSGGMGGENPFSGGMGGENPFSGGTEAGGNPFSGGMGGGNPFSGGGNPFS